MHSTRPMRNQIQTRARFYVLSALALVVAGAFVNLWLEVRSTAAGATAAGRLDRARERYACRGAAVATPTSSRVVDGDAGDWPEAAFIPLGAGAYTSFVPGHDADVSGRFALAWSESAIYAVVEVTDDVHVNDEQAAELWKGDSVQMAFDVAGDGGVGYDGDDDFELGWALIGGRSVSFQFAAPAGARVGSRATIARRGGRTTYEIEIPLAGLGVRGNAGEKVGFALLVNDNDGAGRAGFLEWASGIGMHKAPSLFGGLCLLDDALAEPR